MRKAFLFALLVATNIIINLDHGIIPAGNNKIIINLIVTL